MKIIIDIVSARLDYHKNSFEAHSVFIQNYNSDYNNNL